MIDVLRGRERREALIRVVDRVHLLGLRSGAETEVLRELVRGRRTIRELVYLVYGEDTDSPTFESRYAKTRRALKALGSKGYVTSSLFGREKTFKLTRHGERTLISIATGYPEPRLLGTPDIALLSTTFILGFASIMGMKLTGGLSPLVSSFFLILLGASLCRTAMILREVG